jgi:hypothetical protein
MPFAGILIRLGFSPPDVVRIAHNSIASRSGAVQAKEPQTARYKFGSGLFHLTHGAVEFVRPVIGCPKNVYGEFDPGSELTLAACLTHASRAVTTL